MGGVGVVVGGVGAADAVGLCCGEGGVGGWVPTGLEVGSAFGVGVGDGTDDGVGCGVDGDTAGSVGVGIAVSVAVGDGVVEGLVSSTDVSVGVCTVTNISIRGRACSSLAITPADRATETTRTVIRFA